MKASALRSFGRTHVGNVRKANEDSLLLVPDAMLYCVADGMGGVAGGEFASQTVCDAVGQAAGLFSATTTMEERVAALRNAIDRASRDIRSWAENHGVEGTGTTVVMMLFDPRRQDHGVILHAGDSRVYRCRGGRLEPLTRDHSVAESYGNGKDEAVPAMFRNVVTNAIGLSNNVRLEETSVQHRRGDVILLCSDGLYRMVEEKDLVRILLEPTSLNERGDHLLQAALDGGGRDNVTLILLAQDAEEQGNEPSEQDTHETDVRSAREAANERNQSVHRSSENTEIEGRSFTEEPETHDRIPQITPTEQARSRGKAYIATGLIMLIVMILVMLVWPGEEAVPPAAPPADVPAELPSTLRVDLPEGLAAETERVAEPMEPSAPPMSLAERVARAKTSGTWNLVAEQMAGPHEEGVHQGVEVDVVRSWIAEWERARGNPGLARAELELYHENAERLIGLWSSDVSLPELERWSDSRDEAASIFCRNLYAIQQVLFKRMDHFVSDAIQVISAFGATPDQVEGWLRAASVHRTGEEPRLAPKLNELRDVARGLNRWKGQTRDLPVGLTDLRGVTATFIEPLEQGLRGVMDEVAEYLGEIPSLPEAMETRMAVRTFYEQKDQLLREIGNKLHHRSTGREQLAPVLADLLNSPGLRDLAETGLQGGGR